MGENSFLQELRTTQSCPSLTLPVLEDLLAPYSSSLGGNCLMQMCRSAGETQL